MNKKEREAIEYYQDKEISFGVNFDTEKLLKALGITEEDSFKNHQIRFKTLLNLIEKLQKENEELKFEERRRIIGKYGDAEIHDVINRTLSNDYIPVQKVKDNIKKLEIKKEKARGERDILERFAIEKSINSLQELLYGRNK